MWLDALVAETHLYLLIPPLATPMATPMAMLMATPMAGGIED